MLLFLTEHLPMFLILHTYIFLFSGTYPEIGDANIKCALLTCKQQLALKML